jgi:hypothetical protein
MGRFSTGVRILSRRLQRLEYQRCNDQFPEALSEYSLTGKLPDNIQLREKIYLVQAAIKAMIATMPGPAEE